MQTIALNTWDGDATLPGIRISIVGGHRQSGLSLLHPLPHHGLSFQQGISPEQGPAQYFVEYILHFYTNMCNKKLMKKKDGKTCKSRFP